VPCHGVTQRCASADGRQHNEQLKRESRRGSGAATPRKPNKSSCHQDARSSFPLSPQVDQAALTGESLPVKKFTGDVAFSGSSIKQGERHAVVYATGQKTFFGRAAALIQGETCGIVGRERRVPFLHTGHTRGIIRATQLRGESCM
jgi:hypothetical protein